MSQTGLSSDQGTPQPTDTEDGSHKLQTQLEKVSRKSTLTQNVNQEYTKSCDAYLSSLEKAWQDIEQHIDIINSEEGDLIILRQNEKHLQKLYNSYKHLHCDFLVFLQSTSTEDCDREIEKQNLHHDKVEETTNQVLNTMNNKIDKLLMNMSELKSKTSHKSGNTSVLSRKQARAETARAKVHYAMKENELMKEQARLAAENELQRAQLEASSKRKQAELTADINLLKMQSEVAVAEAEVQALHSSQDLSDNLSPPILVPIETKIQRTSRYISEQSFNKNQDLDNVNNNENQIHQNEQTNVKLNATTPPFVPQLSNNLTSYPPLTPGNNFDPMTFDLSRFLMKKELLITRLSKFNDKPECFAAWRSSFVNIMNELQVSPSEEIDLLIKWLGPDSSKHATSLRYSNTSNPERGLQRIWQRLIDRYGAPEAIESALRRKLDSFPKLNNKDNTKLFDLADLVSEIESLKEDSTYSPILAYFDASSGVKPIVDKLPHSLQEKWISHALHYKKSKRVAFPPFTVFAEFLRETSKDRNDPSFSRETMTSEQAPQRQSSFHTRKIISARKTDISETQQKSPVFCPIHERSRHSLNECRGFRMKPIAERRGTVKELGLCFKCCETNSHSVKDCDKRVVCALCKSDHHPSALHVSSNNFNNNTARRQPSHGGEKASNKEPDASIDTKCTQVCGKGFSGKSCSKIILVNVYPKDNPEQSRKTYCILDDQSNASLAKSEFFDNLNIDSDPVPYALSSCSGTFDTSGRRASNIVVESLDGNSRLLLSNLIECNSIPNSRTEIPTPEVAQNYTHLNQLTSCIPPLDNETEILLLLGRDLLEAHQVSEQIIGPRGTPFAQKLSLGWVIVGQACLGKAHQPEVVQTFKTYIHENGRPSYLEPCSNFLNLKHTPVPRHSNQLDHHTLGSSVFQKTPDDDKIAMSIEDHKFIESMKNIRRNAKGNLVAPLPFKESRQRLPNNRTQALRRAYTLASNLKKNSVKRDQFVKFMARMLKNGHAEIAEPPKPNEEVWYLPIFGVYHPKKKDEVRVVFDSSAQHEGVSLNQVLMPGPDLTNSLLGILMRFRRDPVAVTADIEQMFYGFYVNEEHRNFLRFLWHEENDPFKPIIEYRMCVHVFGNTTSPAISTYGLRKIAQTGESIYGSDTLHFVENDFYVDDAVVSLPDVEKAIGLLTRTRQSLLTFGNLRLHKIASNSIEVMKAFPADDLAKNLRDLDLGTDSLPPQRSLGLVWDMQLDVLTFKVDPQEKPYTRRGLLSTVNSIFDPLGFASPITIQGRLLLRDLLAHTKDWDEPLPPDRQAEWNKWKSSIKVLEELSIPRSYLPCSFDCTQDKEVHIFSDASELAIASVAYLRSSRQEDNWSYILGKTKVAPVNAHTIPRLELCAAIISVEIAETITEHLTIPIASMKFHTDSRIVLGYINNETRRFNVYVANRVNHIRRSTSADQWFYVSTNHNPADKATRPNNTEELHKGQWLCGPSAAIKVDISETFQLVDPDNDEAIKKVTVLSTTTTVPHASLSSRFDRFSTWMSLVRTVGNLKHVSRSYRTKECQGWHVSEFCRSTSLRQETEILILKQIQSDTYQTEINSILCGKPLPKNSSIISLNPFINEDGLLVVGGRLRKAEIQEKSKHPVIIPGTHHVATLLVRHFHTEVHHQGRHITEGRVRQAGYWITGGKRLISSVIYRCVKCRKLRGRQQTQIMADLPESRLQPAPPFSYVG